MTGAGLALVDDCPERGGEPATEAGSGGEIHVFRKTDQVQIGLVDTNIFGKGSPVGEAGLFLIVTDLLVTSMTLRA